MMRKVTQNAINAFILNQNFSSSNTDVIVHSNGTELVLHGNCIASKQKGILTITNCGWFTNTTKERLNAIPGVNIHQENFKWYLNGEEWDGKLTKIKI